MLSLKQIVQCLGQPNIGNAKASIIYKYLHTDTRKILTAEQSIFIALQTEQGNGNQYINQALEQGVRCIICNQLPTNIKWPPKTIIFKVKNTLLALQQLVTVHRQNNKANTIAITGSNGKTIVKEWLYHLLTAHKKNHTIYRSPLSYNSQIGVPLSVWQLSSQHKTAIIEAGISTTGEMAKLEKIIQPQIGLFTHLGSAHDEGFANRKEKLKEKCKLFTNCKQVIYNNDDLELPIPSTKKITWGKNGNYVAVKKISTNGNHTIIQFICKGKNHELSFPFTESLHINNAMLAVTAALWLNTPFTQIKYNCNSLELPSMRLTITEGINNCTLINDAYTWDKEALQAALQAAHNHSQGKPIILILGNDNLGTVNQLTELSKLLKQQPIYKCIGIGNFFYNHQSYWLKELKHVTQVLFYPQVKQFADAYLPQQFNNELVLLKAPRSMAFEQIVNMLTLKKHSTYCQINLTALIHNLKTIQAAITKRNQRPLKTMAMLKAFGYGMGTAEVATTLQAAGLNYIAVAYTDEGIALRKKNISLPILVMNPEIDNWTDVFNYNLEPEVFNIKQWQAIANHINKTGLPQVAVHIKLDTGMHRLGFSQTEQKELLEAIKKEKRIIIKSVFTHLAAADDPKQNNYTRQQYKELNQFVISLQKIIKYPFDVHAANSAGALYHKNKQCTMVRLGLALYGIEPSAAHNHKLEPILSFKTTIAQIKNIQKGETVGYARSYAARAHKRIATVRVGYADGLPRSLSNGKGNLYLHGKPCPIIGRVCMDMTMIDITHVPQAAEGDEVTIIGKEQTATQIAMQAGTISYEILTGIGQRIPRVFIG
jgi:Alr-MurF fusion protein